MYNVRQQDTFTVNSEVPAYYKHVIVHPQIVTETYAEPTPTVLPQIGKRQEIPVTSFRNGNNILKKHLQCSNKKEKNTKGSIDTSLFTVEERLISSVWVHERFRNRISIGQIKKDFQQRFNKAAPTKNTLLVWEKKLFSTGNAMDAQRSGRPCIRNKHLDTVKASIASSPGLSLRARASALSLPRTTLRKIMCDDLKVNKQTNKKEEISKVLKKRSTVKPAESKPKEKIARTQNQELIKNPQQTARQETHPQIHHQTHVNYRSYNDQQMPIHQFTNYAPNSNVKHMSFTPIPHQQYVVANVQTHMHNAIS